jgi:hypothetical protein
MPAKLALDLGRPQAASASFSAALVLFAVVLAALLLPVWCWLLAAWVLGLGIALPCAEARRDALLDLPSVRHQGAE